MGWLRETLAAQHVEEHLRMLPAHVGIAFAFGRPVTEMAPAIDHLLGRAPADPELRPAIGDEIGGARVFRHVKRVLVAHIDDGRFRRCGLSWRRRRPAEETAKRAGGRNDGHGNRLMGPELLGRLRPDRSTARAHQPPSGSAVAGKASSGRKRGSRFFSCGLRLFRIGMKQWIDRGSF